MNNKEKFVDLIITEAKSDSLGSVARHFRRCSISRLGSQHVINLELPAQVQETILRAYEQGKQVRIFA